MPGYGASYINFIVEQINIQFKINPNLLHVIQRRVNMPVYLSDCEYSKHSFIKAPGTNIWLVNNTFKDLGDNTVRMNSIIRMVDETVFNCTFSAVMDVDSAILDSIEAQSALLVSMASNRSLGAEPMMGRRLVTVERSICDPASWHLFIRALPCNIYTK